MMSISVDAADARESLADDRQLVNTFEVQKHYAISMVNASRN